MATTSKLTDEERIDMMITNAEEHENKYAQLLLFECTEGDATVREANDPNGCWTVPIRVMDERCLDWV